MNLYELSTEYKSALTRLNDLDLPEQAVKDTLEGMEGELKEKCINVAAYQQNILALAQAKRDAAKRLNEQAKIIEGKAQSLIDYLDSNMKLAGISEIECPLFTVKYRKNPPSVVIEDEEKIDSKYVKEKLTKSLDKVAIKKAIQSGEEVDGASIEQRSKLVIV